MANEEFVHTNWTSGDKITQTKKRQERDNFAYLRTRCDDRGLFYSDYALTIDGLISHPGLPDIIVQVFVDGEEQATQTITNGNGAVKFSNIDLSGFGEGVHTFRIVSVIGGNTLRFNKPKDMNEMTIWGDLLQSFESHIEDEQTRYSLTRSLTNITVIIHREEQEW